MQSGDWLLLDEINLASSETLECLSGILESAQGSVVLLEKGDSKPIERNPEFRFVANCKLRKFKVFFALETYQELGLTSFKA